MPHRPLRSALRDGSAEIAVGLAFLLGGFVTMVIELFLPGWPAWVWQLQLLGWLVAGLHLAAGLAARRLEPAPGRGGPGAPAERGDWRPAAAIAVGLALLLAERAVAAWLPDAGSVAPRLAVMAGLGWLAAAGYARRLRPVVLAAAAPVTTLLLHRGAVPMAEVSFLEAMGLLTLLSGVLAWRRRHARRPAEALGG